MWYFTFKKSYGKLIFNDFGGYESRNPSTIWCINEADKIYHWKDFNEIVVSTNDFEDDPNALTYTKTNRNYAKMVPDFNFHAWPQVGLHDYDQVVREVHEAGCHPPVINKVGWIGNADTHPNRIELSNIGRNNRDLMDIQTMQWLPSPHGGINYMSLPELVSKYSMLIDIEGRGYSARLKYLLWSHRPVLLVDRPHHEYYYEHLIPWKHFIPVKRDLSDILEKIIWCQSHPRESREIADQAFQFSETFLTREACYNKWNQVVSLYV